MSFDAWLDESDNGEIKEEQKFTVELLKKNAKERVKNMFSEQAFGDRLVQILIEME